MINKQKIVDIFDNFEIPNWTSGKNVTRGWVNIQCPFCDDGSNHCGTNPTTELFSCWRCGKTGHFVDLLVTLTGLPFSQCKEVVSESSISFKEHPEEEAPEADLVVKVEPELPKRFELITNDTEFSLLDSYLERRNILRSTLVEHECGICRTGRYMNRMIIPVFYKGKLVSFQGADLTGWANLKYRSAPIEMGAINNFLYNYDRITGGRMIVEEGVLDAWRTGDEAVAAFTSTITKEQKKLILAKGLEELYFCFDCELTAYYKAVEIAKEFEAYISTVEVLRLPFGQDPDEVGKEKIYQIIRELSV